MRKFIGVFFLALIALVSRPGTSAPVPPEPPFHINQPLPGTSAPVPPETCPPVCCTLDCN
jgi:hypothetical protein